MPEIPATTHGSGRSSIGPRFKKVSGPGSVAEFDGWAVKMVALASVTSKKFFFQDVLPRVAKNCPLQLFFSSKRKILRSVHPDKSNASRFIDSNIAWNILFLESFECLMSLIGELIAPHLRV